MLEAKKLNFGILTKNGQKHKKRYQKGIVDKQKVRLSVP